MYKSPRTIKGRMCGSQKASWFSDRRGNGVAETRLKVW